MSRRRSTAIGVAELCTGAICQPGQKLGEVAAVFPRVDAKASIEKMQELEDEEAGAASGAVGQRRQPEPAADGASRRRRAQITIDDFAKVDLRVGHGASPPRR